MYDLTTKRMIEKIRCFPKEFTHFQNLTEIIADILYHCGEHLWMTGADYEVGYHRKYKIYVKNTNNIYEKLGNRKLNIERVLQRKIQLYAPEEIIRYAEEYQQ